METVNKIINEAKNKLIEIITAAVPNDTGRQLTFNEGECTHEAFSEDKKYTEHFKRAYLYEETGEIVLEYSDHIRSESRIPGKGEWYADSIEESFSLDELVEVATAIEYGKYHIEDKKED